MTSRARKNGVVVALVLGLGLGMGTLMACEAPISDDQSQWIMTLESPAPPEDNLIEWCPQLMFTQFSQVDGLPFRSTDVPAPTNVPTSLSLVDDDIYTLSPAFNAVLFGPPIEFDTGPLGTFYSKSDAEFTIGTTDVGVEPASFNVVRRVIGGTVDSDEDFTLTLDYDFDCDEIVAGEDSCTCDTQRLTWRFKPGAPVF